MYEPRLEVYPDMPPPSPPSCLRRHQRMKNTQPTPTPTAPNTLAHTIPTTAPTPKAFLPAPPGVLFVVGTNADDGVGTLGAGGDGGTIGVVEEDGDDGRTWWGMRMGKDGPLKCVANPPGPSVLI